MSTNVPPQAELEKLQTKVKELKEAIRLLKWRMLFVSVGAGATIALATLLNQPPVHICPHHQDEAPQIVPEQDDPLQSPAVPV